MLGCTTEVVPFLLGSLYMTKAFQGPFGQAMNTEIKQSVSKMRTHIMILIFLFKTVSS